MHLQIFKSVFFSTEVLLNRYYSYITIDKNKFGILFSNVALTFASLFTAELNNWQTDLDRKCNGVCKLRMNSQKV